MKRDYDIASVGLIAFPGIKRTKRPDMKRDYDRLLDALHGILPFLNKKT